MKPIKRDMFFFVAATAFVFLCALIWGGPFLRIAPATRVMAQTHTAPAGSMVFKGVILRNGGQFVLRDSSGQAFRLDDAQRVQAMENQTVVVTGRLDDSAKLIHVESVDRAHP